jgi:glycosyltransferase involved in cell wall biosynthesis
MLAILTTHPIQYQVPLWQMLARDGRVPFEVWYLSKHATERSVDQEFKQEFAWDLDMLSGYRYRVLKTPAGATPNTRLRCRVAESLPELFQETKTKVLWVNGWQVAAYWQAVWAAHRTRAVAGIGDPGPVQVWLRGESNALRQQGSEGKEPRKRLMSHAVNVRQMAKRVLLGQLFKRVDHFLCIGTANRELYRSYGVPESKLHMAMYAVDNERFAAQAAALRGRRSVVRSQWSIPEDSFCVLFCGKFIPKKRPLDLINAAQLLLASHPELKIHLLFAGSGELGVELRVNCDVVYDEEQGAGSRGQGGASDSDAPSSKLPAPSFKKPAASFAGFLNQTEISKAYVAADCLVLPSDYDETWGLVVNEAMASGLPCIISDRCGCAPDLGQCSGNVIFRFGDVEDLAKKLVEVSANKQPVGNPPSLDQTIVPIKLLYLK